MRAEFHAEAEEEFIEASQFYNSRVPGLGDRFISEVEQAILLLTEKPRIGQLMDEVFRRVVLDRFPYSIIYSIELEKIWIVAVAHQRRRPGYWRNRVDP